MAGTTVREKGTTIINAQILLNMKLSSGQMFCTCPASIQPKAQ